MRNLKRLLGLVMAVAMMMSMVVFSASAASISFPDADDIVHTEAVNMAVALNIIEGRDTGEFDPKADVKRGEMAKMITIILAGGNQPTVPTTAGGTYTDIATHWARDYIEYCSTYSAQNYDSGIINGYPDGTFRPDATVTGTEAAKMLLVAMGYNADAAGFTGSSWAMNINVQANSRGLYEDVTMTDPNTNLTRDDAAQMIWNALNATMVQYDISPTSDGQGGITVAYIQKNYEDRNGDPYTMLREFYKAETTYEGIMEEYSWNVRENKFQYKVYIKSEKDTVDYYSDVDYSDYFGMNVKVVYKEQNNETTVLGMYAYKSSVLATGIIDDLEESTTREIKLDGDKYSLSETGTGGLEDLMMIAQNQYEDGVKYAKLMDDDKDAKGDPRGVVNAYEVRLIDSSGDGKVDHAVYLPFSYGEVNTVNSSKISVKDVQGYEIENGKKTLTLDFADHDIYEDPKSGDYVKVIDADFTAYDKHVVTIMDNFDGVVTGKRNDGEDIAIDGTWYANGNLKSPVDVSVDGEYTFYGIGSFIYYVDEISTPEIDNVVYLANYQTPYDGEYNVRLYFAGGGNQTVSLKEMKVNVDKGGDKAYTNTTVKPADIRDGISLTIDKETKTYREESFFDRFIGHVFTYTVKNGEYTLTEVGQANRMGYTAIYDNTYSGGYTTLNKATTSRDARLNISGGAAFFADDAVVFFTTNDGIDVVTGARAKNIKTDMTKIEEVYGLYTTSGGSKYIKVASIISKDAELPGSLASVGNYGYVVDTYSANHPDGDAATAVRLYNPDDDAVVVKFATDEPGYVAKGQVVAYDDLGDDEIEEVFVFDGDVKSTSKYDTDKTSIWGAIESSADGKYLEVYDEYGTLHFITITSDTKFITVDTNATKVNSIISSANSSGSMTDADEDLDDVNKSSYDFNGYIPNVLVVAEPDGNDWEAALVVIDDGNEYLSVVERNGNTKDITVP